MITKAEAERFVHGVFNEVWCKRNKEAVQKYYHKEFLGLLHGTEEFTYDDVLKRVDYSRERYENPRCYFHEIFSVDNKIIARVTMMAFDRHEQKEITLHLMAVIEMKEGRMYRQWTLSSQPYRYKDWD